MKAPVYDLTGTKIKDLILNKDIFEAKINDDLMTQSVKVYLANQRKANPKTLTRSQVDRTTKKVYRQKGTGGARHGSRKAPIYVGGGIAHGPDGTQNYSLKLNQKMKNAALKSALSQLASDKKIIILDGLKNFKKPSTQKIDKLLTKLVKNPRDIKIIVDTDMDMVIKSSKNLVYSDCINAMQLNAFQVLRSKTLVLSLESLKILNERLEK